MFQFCLACRYLYDVPLSVTMAWQLPQADLQRYVVPVARAVFRTVQAAEHVASDPRQADAHPDQSKHSRRPLRR